MLELNRMLQGLSQSGITSGLVGGVAGGLATSALSGKRGRRVAKTVLQVGGIAAAGGLAFKAYQAYRHRNQVGGSGSGPDGGGTNPWRGLASSRFRSLAQGIGTPDDRLLVVRAMIAAALADGRLDASERERIFQQLDELGLSDRANGMLVEELRNPPTLDSLVNSVPDAEAAIEVYAASVLTIDETKPEGQDYLDRLAGALAIPWELRAEVHAKLAETNDQMIAA